MYENIELPVRHCIALICSGQAQHFSLLYFISFCLSAQQSADRSVFWTSAQVPMTCPPIWYVCKCVLVHNA